LRRGFTSTIAKPLEAIDRITVAWINCDFRLENVRNREVFTQLADGGTHCSRTAAVAVQLSNQD
jgi:hypothetical protein